MPLIELHSINSDYYNILKFILRTWSIFIIFVYSVLLFWNIHPSIFKIFHRISTIFFWSKILTGIIVKWWLKIKSLLYCNEENKPSTIFYMVPELEGDQIFLESPKRVGLFVIVWHKDSFKIFTLKISLVAVLLSLLTLITLTHI